MPKINIQETIAKTILVKSKLPKVDYTIEKTTVADRKKLSYLDKIVLTE